MRYVRIWFSTAPEEHILKGGGGQYDSEENMGALLCDSPDAVEFHSHNGQGGHHDGIGRKRAQLHHH